MAVTSIIIVGLCLLTISVADRFERDLYARLLSDYNLLVRPVLNSSMPVVVKMKLVLNQIVDVDEKSQIIQVNIWIQQEWTDQYLTWNVSEYGGVADVRIPPGTLWQPDTLLYNSADSNFVVTHLTNFVVYSDGSVAWLPPAFVKFSCTIHTRWFPFDEQECFLKFGSWTYHGFKLDLIDGGWDMSEYVQNCEWYLIGYNVVRTIKVYDCCPEPYPDLKFYLRIRRRPLYYGVNIIFPTLLVGITSILGFALPIESGEKVTLEITILLSICVFLGMLTSMIPASSDSLPLLCIYFCFNMIIVSMSVVANVFILNLRYRKPEKTRAISGRTRQVMLNWLPWLLMMSRPGYILGPSKTSRRSSRHRRLRSIWEYGGTASVHELQMIAPARAESGRESPINPLNKQRNGIKSTSPIRRPEYLLSGPGPEQKVSQINHILSGITENLRFMSSRINKEDLIQQAMNEWRFVAVVFDRLCLFFFSFILVASTCLIFASPYFG